MLAWLFGAACGIALTLAGAALVRARIVPAQMLRLFTTLPKTMRFDLATPQSMKNMVVMAEPWLEPWFSERAAGQMLDTLRRRFPAHSPRQSETSELPTHAPRAVTYYPTAAPPVGVKLPPEYGPLDGVLIAWPWHYPSRWEPHAAFISAITQADARVMLVTPADQDSGQLEPFLVDRGIDMRRVDLVEGPVDDVWIRDYGPTFVTLPDGSAAIVANAYAPGEHPYRKGDNAVSYVIGAALDLPVYRLPLLIEGGNMVTDGLGLMIMTASVIDRNPEFDTAGVGDIMRRYFGCDRCLFIESLPAEVTGHADMVVRFLDPHIVVVAAAPAGHRWAAAFDRVAAIISATPAHDGSPLIVHRLQIAVSKKDRSAFWSYVNCLQVNGTTIVPIFGVPTDAMAIAFYKSLMSGPVVGIDFSDFLVGSVHCQSKELPAGALRGGSRLT